MAANGALFLAVAPVLAVLLLRDLDTCVLNVAGAGRGRTGCHQRDSSDG